ncbi:C40 family peptidase [Frankia sp. CiP1_Cm_nod1]|uniref:C40 family peptidase n=1 Tax=Frankia sp. CiP1_Cm_nod1 TaxID=2897160 RepID=UPI002025AE79
MDTYTAPETGTGSTGGAGAEDTAPSTAALVAIDYATAQLGLPYEWGGNGPAYGEGFDCSGLTQAAWAAAGVRIPRTAQTQYDAGPRLPADIPLAPGDLLFYGTRTAIHHVALYLGGGTIVTAPGRGKTIRISSARWPGDDYAGATRPG